MKRIYERLDLYFILFYFVVGGYIMYFQERYFNFHSETDSLRNALFIIFYIFLILLDVFILIISNKKSLKSTLKSMMVANLFFLIGDYITVLPESIFREITGLGNSRPYICEFFFQYLYDSYLPDLVYIVFKISFAVISVLNILMLIPNPPKILDKKK